MRNRLRRLERISGEARQAVEAREIFLHGLAQIHALVDGKEPPPPHPEANLAGGFMSGTHEIVGLEAGQKLKDLSE